MPGGGGAERKALPSAVSWAVLTISLASAVPERLGGPSPGTSHDVPAINLKLLDGHAEPADRLAPRGRYWPVSTISFDGGWVDDQMRGGSWQGVRFRPTSAWPKVTDCRAREMKDGLYPYGVARSPF